MDRSTRTGRGSAWKLMDDGVAWKTLTLAVLTTGALGLGGVAHATPPGVTLPAPALEKGNAQAHVPTPHEPVLALSGSRWS